MCAFTLNLKKKKMLGECNIPETKELFILRLVLKKESLVSPALYMQIKVYKKIYYNDILKVIISALI